MASVPADYLRAAERYGHSVDQIASQYVNPVTGKRLTGEALLLKLGKGESGFNANADSGKAHGYTQFTPASRQVAISKFGVDPNKDADSAVHAAALHLRGKINGSTGLRGYNPGMASYTDYILGQRIGKITGGGGTSSTPSVLERAKGGSTSVTSTAVDPGAASTAEVDALGAALRGGGGGVASTAPAAPTFAARPVTPELYGGGLGFSAPQPQAPDLSAALAEIGSQVGQDSVVSSETTQTGQASSGSGAQAGSAGGVKLGKVRVAPGANRPGVDITPGLRHVVGIIAGATGEEITIGTGTAHNRMTTSGNVSDHWSGNGADIPRTGAALTTLFAKSLNAVGRGKTVQFLGNEGTRNVKLTPASIKQIAKEGGIVNIPYGKHRRIQLIANTDQGGNHHNHMHAGVTALGA
jgi:hypothetical protein